MIRSPIIIEGGLLEWVDTAKVGVSTKELRSDPGNGSKTWLVSVATGAVAGLGVIERVARGISDYR